MTLQDIVIIANPTLLGIAAFFFSKRLKKIEVSLAKEQYIHQIRFNREFDIYQFLWKKLATLIRKSELLTYSGYYDPRGDSRAKEFGEAFAATFKVLDNNIPFFSPTVYEPARKILNLINKETSSIRLALSQGFKDPEFNDFDKVKEAITEIRPYVEEVKMAIRERIYDKEEK